MDAHISGIENIGSRLRMVRREKDLKQAELGGLVSTSQGSIQKIENGKSSGVSLPRERFWDIPVPKIDSPTRQPLCPGTPCGRRWTRQTHAEPNTANKWLDGVSDVLVDFRHLSFCLQSS